MTKDKEFHSVLKPFLDGFVEEKTRQGYDYRAAVENLRMFDAYWEKTQGSSLALTRDAIEPWCLRKPTEGPGFQHARVSPLRQFTLYMSGLGHACWIPDMKIKVPRPMIHVLSMDELMELLRVVDEIEFNPKSKRARTLGKAHPVIFRLLLGTGIRVGEAVALHIDDVDLDLGVIHVLQAKGRKDRLVYMAPDMTKLLSDYILWLRDKFGPDEIWLFPGKKAGTHMSRDAVSGHFERCWNETKYATLCSKKPTIHGLRHLYTCLRINGWTTAGLDFDVMRAYLARQLGHETSDQVYMYFHQVQQNLSVIRNMDRSGAAAITEPEG